MRGFLLSQGSLAAVRVGRIFQIIRHIFGSIFHLVADFIDGIFEIIRFVIAASSERKGEKSGEGRKSDFFWTSSVPFKVRSW